MTTPSVAFIGGGNMAAALIDGIVSAGNGTRVSVSEPDDARRGLLATRFAGVDIAADNAAAAAAADTVVLATKPDVLPLVCEELRAKALTAARTFVSVAAGVRLARLAIWLGPTGGLVRAMPNQPAAVRCGLTALVATKETTRAAALQVEVLFNGAGDVIWLDDEAQMNASTALSGSGPAYFYRLMEILTANAVDRGFDPATARRIAVATARGAAEVAASSDETLDALRDQVTSPGGTTAAALQVLAEADIHAIFSRAIDAAIQRGDELDQAAGD